MYKIVKVYNIIFFDRVTMWFYSYDLTILQLLMIIHFGNYFFFHLELVYARGERSKSNEFSIIEISPLTYSNYYLFERNLKKLNFYPVMYRVS